jgi:hypothetical protein
MVLMFHGHYVVNRIDKKLATGKSATVQTKIKYLMKWRNYMRKAALYNLKAKLIRI